MLGLIELTRLGPVRSKGVVEANEAKPPLVTARAPADEILGMNVGAASLDER